MKTPHDVQTPYTNGVAPVPSGAGANTVTSGGFDLGPGTVKETPHQAGPTVTTFTPQGGASTPGKLDGAGNVVPRKYHGIPNIEP
jgi:hypothetical protein